MASHKNAPTQEEVRQWATKFNLPLDMKQCYNPYTGESFVFLEERKPNVCEFLYSIQAKSEKVKDITRVMPFMHSHPEQIETFRVLEGVLHIDDGQKVIELKPGEELAMHPYENHQPASGSEETLFVLVSVEPKLQFREAIETVAGLAADGKTDKKGRPSLWQMMVILYDRPGNGLSSDYPIWFQYTMAYLLGPVLKLFGYKGHYPKYSK